MFVVSCFLFVDFFLLFVVWRLQLVGTRFLIPVVDGMLFDACCLLFVV